LSADEETRKPPRSHKRPLGRSLSLKAPSQLSVCARVKHELISSFNLHTVVRLPEGVFSPYTDIPTNLLFFDTSGPTKETWFYEHPLPEGRKKYTKTKPLQYSEFEPLITWWGARIESERAWRVELGALSVRDTAGTVVGLNLDVKNPRATDHTDRRSSQQIIADIEANERAVLALVEQMRALVLQTPRASVS
jgi:type I restriction enzyme M protein